MSPEAIEGNPYTFANDVWSAGCILFDLCALRRAFTREGEVFRVELTGVPRIVKHILANDDDFTDLSAFCEQMMDIKAKDRPSCDDVRLHFHNINQFIPADKNIWTADEMPEDFKFSQGDLGLGFYKAGYQGTEQVDRLTKKDEERLAKELEDLAADQPWQKKWFGDNLLAKRLFANKRGALERIKEEDYDQLAIQTQINIKDIMQENDDLGQEILSRNRLYEDRLKQYRHRTLMEHDKNGQIIDQSEWRVLYVEKNNSSDKPYYEYVLGVVGDNVQFVPVRFSKLHACHTDLMNNDGEYAAHMATVGFPPKNEFDFSSKPKRVQAELRRPRLQLWLSHAQQVDVFDKIIHRFLPFRIGSYVTIQPGQSREFFWMKDDGTPDKKNCHTKPVPEHCIGKVHKALHTSNDRHITVISGDFDGFGVVVTVEELIPLPKDEIPEATVLKGDNGNYMILKKIGEGAFSEVFKVQCTNENDKVYALKQFFGSSTALHEAKILFELKKHDNVVQYKDWFLIPLTSQCYLVIDYASGGDLSEHIRRQREEGLSWDKISIIDRTKQILGGLEHLHSNRIIHRDLKPQNILVFETGLLKISDFGLSRKLNEESSVAKTRRVGTPIYMAPELQSRRHTFAVDIWSLGCVLYELCMLQNAFNDQREIFEGIKPQISPISPTREDWQVFNFVCSMMLDQNPENRWCSRAWFEVFSTKQKHIGSDSKDGTEDLSSVPPSTGDHQEVEKISNDVKSKPPLTKASSTQNLPSPQNHGEANPSNAHKKFRINAEGIMSEIISPRKQNNLSIGLSEVTNAESQQIGVDCKARNCKVRALRALLFPLAISSFDDVVAILEKVSQNFNSSTSHRDLELYRLEFEMHMQHILKIQKSVDEAQRRELDLLVKASEDAEISAKIRLKKEVDEQRKQSKHKVAVPQGDPLLRHSGGVSKVSVLGASSRSDPEHLPGGSRSVNLMQSHNNQKLLPTSSSTSIFSLPASTQIEIGSSSVAGTESFLSAVNEHSLVTNSATDQVEKSGQEEKATESMPEQK